MTTILIDALTYKYTIIYRHTVCRTCIYLYQENRQTLSLDDESNRWPYDAVEVVSGNKDVLLKEEMLKTERKTRFLDFHPRTKHQKRKREERHCWNYKHICFQSCLFQHIRWIRECVYSADCPLDLHWFCFSIIGDVMTLFAIVSLHSKCGERRVWASITSRQLMKGIELIWSLNNNSARLNWSNLKIDKQETVGHRRWITARQGEIGSNSNPTGNGEEHFRKRNESER